MISEIEKPEGESSIKDECTPESIFTKIRERIFGIKKTDVQPELESEYKLEPIFSEAERSRSEIEEFEEDIKNRVYTKTIVDLQHRIREGIEYDPRLINYKLDWEKWDDKLKNEMPFEEIRRRLLANDGALLKRAEALTGGGVLFGVDENGRAVFTDVDDELFNSLLSYKQALNVVRFETEKGMFKIKNGQKIPTGYDMFSKGLIEMFVKFTGYKGGSDTGRNLIWLYSGENPVKRALGCSFVYETPFVSWTCPNGPFGGALLGVKRVLYV